MLSLHFARKAVSPLLAISTTLLLCACATSGKEPLARQLPAYPSFGQPVEVSAPKAGEDAVNVAARERAGRIAANGRLVNVAGWYAGVRRSYSGAR